MVKEPNPSPKRRRALQAQSARKRVAFGRSQDPADSSNPLHAVKPPPPPPPPPKKK